MRIVAIILLLAAARGQAEPSARLPPTDAIRIAEFYRLAPLIEDKIWPDWSNVSAPLLLVTNDAEFLTRHPSPPKGFTKLTEDTYERPRQFPTNLLATFPAFGPPSVIVIGEPENTDAKTTPESSGESVGKTTQASYPESPNAIASNPESSRPM